MPNTAYISNKRKMKYRPMSTASHQSDSHYIHGSSPAEQARLSLLNDLLNQAYLKEMNLAQERRILDIGSGLGQFTRLMAKVTDHAPFVLGIERDEKQLQQAIDFAQRCNEQDLVLFRQGDATQLPLHTEEWGSFDLVHARFVLEHVRQPALVVQEMAKACKPGGRLILADDDHDIFRLYPECPGFDVLWQAYIRSYDRLGNDPYIGRRLVQLLHQVGMHQTRNTFIFFGDCAGNPTFEAFADNIIGVVNGARSVILAHQLLSEEIFDAGIAAMQQWKKRGDAALWYAMHWAEAYKPRA